MRVPGDGGFRMVLRPSGTSPPDQGQPSDSAEGHLLSPCQIAPDRPPLPMGDFVPARVGADSRPRGRRGQRGRLGGSPPSAGMTKPGFVQRGKAGPLQDSFRRGLTAEGHPHRGPLPTRPRRFPGLRCPLLCGVFVSERFHFCPSRPPPWLLHTCFTRGPRGLAPSCWPGCRGSPRRGRRRPPRRPAGALARASCSEGSGLRRHAVKPSVHSARTCPGPALRQASGRALGP